MSSPIPEADWRRFRELHQKLLERFCSQILEEVSAASRVGTGTSHERYLKIYRLIEERDRQLGMAFDDFRRSTATLQLAIMRRMKLLTDEELSVFSEQTRRQVEGIATL